MSEWEHIARLWEVVGGIFNLLCLLAVSLAVFVTDFMRSGLPPEDPKPDGSFNWLSKGKRDDDQN